ncbi:MAG: TolC family protein [Deltaproteobacteria bacterium]|nr:TolC family protein [Deltaproteobacteria bacterium]
MKTRKNRKGSAGFATLWVVCLLFFLVVMAVKAESVAGERLTLKEAVQAALKNNHELLAQGHAQAAKEAEVGVARSALLPKISLEERYLRTDSPAYAFMAKLNQGRIAAADFAPQSLNRPAAIDDFQTSLAFEQPLFVAKARIGLEMSRKEASASEATLQRKKEETVLKVTQYYLLAGSAGGYVQAAERALEDAREHQRLADVRYGAGLGLYSDTLRAATAVAEARQRLVSAEKNFTVAKRGLGLMIGSREAVEVAMETPALPVRDIAALRARSLVRRDLQSLEIRTENAKNQIRLAEAGYYPLLGLGGNYQWNDHNAPLGGEGRGWQVMAFLRWELFDGTKARYEKIRAGSQAAEAEEQLKGLQKLVAFQVDEAWLTLGEAEKNRELAEEEFKTAEEGRRLVRVRYEGALSPLVDLLDAQVSFDRARANRVARENEYQLAIAWLGFAGGTILQDLQVEEPEGGRK